jgi:hypothetical protein
MSLISLVILISDDACSAQWMIALLDKELSAVIDGMIATSFLVLGADLGGYLDGKR